MTALLVMYIIGRRWWW